MADETQASTDSHAGQAAAATATDQYSVTGKTTVNDADIGGTERLRVSNIDHMEIGFVNAKGQFDRTEVTTHAAQLASQSHTASMQRLEIAAAEQTLAHKDKMNSLEIRQADDNHTARYLATISMTNDAADRAFGTFADEIRARAGDEPTPA